MSSLINALSINGYPVRLEEAANWQTYWGTNHKVFEFILEPSYADALMRAVCSQKKAQLQKGGARGKKISTVARGPIQGSENGELTLEFKKSNGKVYSFKRLILLDEGKRKSPFHKVIRVTDLRALWIDNEIDFSANERRISGKRRVVSPPGVPVAVEQIDDDVTYANLSMNPKTEKPWTAMEVLKEILGRVVGKEGVDWEVRITPIGQTLVQDFAIRKASGHVAVAKALSLIPGANIYQNPDGKYIVDTRFPGHADKVIEGLGASLIVGGEITKLSRATRRNIEHHTLYEREIGYRFDYLEEPNAQRDDTTPWIACVLKATDPKITLPNGKVAIMGTFIEEEQLLSAWNSYLLSTAVPVVIDIISKLPLNIRNVNKFFIRGLERVYTRLGAVADAFDEVLGRYMGEIKGGHRQQFIMNPRYVDACLKIELKNCGFIDFENGTEADSPVFADYSKLPTSKALSANRGKIQDMAFNYIGAVAPYETGGAKGSYLLKDATQAQATASWISQPLGLFRIDFKKSPDGFDEKVVPSAIDNSKIPNGDYFSNIKDFNFAELTSTHKMNIIVSLVPRLPNNDQRLHRIVVTPADILKRFKIDVGECCRSPYEDIVPGGFIHAQHPYQEHLHEEVKKLLGILPGVGNIGIPINQEDLRELALAKALTHYLPLMDHYAGTKTIPMRNDIPLRSEIDQITYTMTKKGALLTTVSCDSPIDTTSIEPLALIPDSARRSLQNSVRVVGA